MDFQYFRNFGWCTNKLGRPAEFRDPVTVTTNFWNSPQPIGCLLFTALFSIFAFPASATIQTSRGSSAQTEAQPKPSTQQEADAAYQWGMKLLGEKKYAEALKQFQFIEEIAPRLPQGPSGKGIALALMGKPGEAVEALQKALEIDPSFWVARRELGIVYWAEGRKEEAAKELDAIHQLFADDAPVDFLLGQYEFERRNYSQAVKFFAKAAPQVDADPRVALMEAQALFQTGHSDKAGEKVERLAHLPGLSAQQKFDLAWMLGQTKRYKQAIELINSLPPDSPDQFSHGYALALAYFEDQQYSKSIETLNTLKIQGTTRPELYSLLGLACEKSSQTLQAYDAFRQGIYAFPKDDRNYLNIATLAVAHLNYEVATQALTSGIARIPADYKLLLSRGLVHSMAGRLAEAQSDFERALTLAPQEGGIYVSLGLCFVDQNRFDDAIETFERGLRQQPKDPLLLYFLADTLLRKGVAPGKPSYDRALQAVESCLAVDPAFTYAFVLRARLEMLSDHLDQAVADLEHARRLEPDSREVLYPLGLAYRRAGKTAEAEKLFARVQETSKEDYQKFLRGKLVDIMVTVSSGSQQTK